MSPQAAFFAGFKHAEYDHKLFDARAFWLGSAAARNLIREGRIEEAAPIIRHMLKTARFLLSGPTKDHALGRRLLQTAQETFAQLIARRSEIWGDR